MRENNLKFRSQRSFGLSDILQLREREIQRQRERQQHNDMMTESVVLMSLWPRVINILISN